MKLRITLATLLMTVCAFAADVTGKWKASIEGPDGQMEVTFNFKQDGAKITGSVLSPMGEMPISEGKLEGEAITFTVATDQFKVVHEGTVSGDEMKLKADIGDHKMEMTAKRAAAAQ